MATNYRCYLLDAYRHIASMQVIECDDDATALLEASRLLELSSGMTVEVWDRNRQVRWRPDGKKRMARPFLTKPSRSGTRRLPRR